MTPREFWTACRLHDWHYMYSDDPGAYRAGREERERLMAVANSGPEFKDIMAAWHAYHFDNAAKPNEPKIDLDETPKEKKAMTYEITNKIPLPGAKRREYKSKYPFREMNKGDSFFVPGITKGGLYQAAYYIVKKTKGKKRFKVIERTENDLKGARVWRVQ